MIEDDSTRAPAADASSRSPTFALHKDRRRSVSGLASGADEGRMLLRAALTLVPLLALGCSSCRKDDDPEARSPHEAGTAPTAPGPTAAVMPAGTPAFPGAEGFGAGARGGRGGAVCAVTTLAREGPGSLQACLDAKGPRTVVFRVSGVVEGPVEIRHGQLTIAGQTSPGGVIVKGGIVCDNVYDPNDCNDVIVRHLRLRGGAPDSLRIGGAHDVIVDHCSLANAEDENLEITRARNVTVQHSIVAEPLGEHYKWGGVLVNYSKDAMPLDGITLHHNLWNGVSGRLPELSCEENTDGPGKSNCSGHVLQVEITNNVYWDVFDPIWYNRCTGTNDGNGCAQSSRDFFLHLNLIGNVMVRRGQTDPDLPLIEPEVWGPAGNAVYASGNRLLRGQAASEVKPVRSAAARHAFPAVTATPAERLIPTVAASVGAAPRDAMDARLCGYLSQPVDARPPAWVGERGVGVADAFRSAAAPPAPPDADGDGMPDAWEAAHGLDPRKADHDDTAFASRSDHRVRGCTKGYTALECYLNELAP
jgi:hypothetical protein